MNLVTPDHWPNWVVQGLILQRAPVGVSLSQILASPCLYPGMGDGELALCPAYLFTGFLIKSSGLLILVLLTSVLS